MSYYWFGGMTQSISIIFNLMVLFWIQFMKDIMLQEFNSYNILVYLSSLFPKVTHCKILIKSYNIIKLLFHSSFIIVFYWLEARKRAWKWGIIHLNTRWPRTREECEGIINKISDIIILYLPGMRYLGQ